MKTTLVINTKGGAGKTTVATNLASYFAAKGAVAAIMDYDPQGSSLQWLRVRPSTLGAIRGADGTAHAEGLRSRRMYVMPNTEHMIIDAPAGASRLLLQDMLRTADQVVIPVGPSAIDIHATANFIKDLLLQGRVCVHGIRVGVVANRVRDSKPVYAPLERFLRALQMDFITRLRDSDAYIEAAETGVGIFEMDENASAKERQEFMPIVEWVGGASKAQESANVVMLPGVQAGAGPVNAGLVTGGA
ncbi:MAG TPA: ParA family protein [Gammaproteobacteria bacterium]|nr:ParA family protein [Gammaproteobacteria bacterium]